MLGLVWSASLELSFLFSAVGSANAVVSANSSVKLHDRLEASCTVRAEATRCDVEAFDGQAVTVYRTTMNNQQPPVA